MLLVVVALISRGSSSPVGPGAPVAYPEHTVEAGAVTVALQLRAIDSTAATIAVTFDTHSGSLDLDVARRAQLVVDGRAWPVAGWSGDGPGGHHREGRLRFTATGPVRGTATLTLDGLGGPVTATWQVTR